MQRDLLAILKNILRLFEKQYMYACTTSDVTITTQDPTSLTLENFKSAGDLFTMESGGIRVNRDCVAMITWQAYFTTGYAKNHILHSILAGGSEGNVIKSSVIQRCPDVTVPYIKIGGSLIAPLQKGELLSLRVRNQTAAQGTIGSGSNNTYLSVAEL